MDLIGKRVEKYNIFTKSMGLIDTYESDLTREVMLEIKRIIETNESYQAWLVGNINIESRDVNIYYIPGTNDTFSLCDNNAFHIFNEVATKLFGETQKGFILTSLFRCENYVDMEMEIENGPLKYSTLRCVDGDEVSFYIEYDVDKIVKLLCKYVEKDNSFSTEKDNIHECVDIFYDLRLANIGKLPIVKTLIGILTNYPNNHTEEMPAKLNDVIAHYSKF